MLNDGWRPEVTAYIALGANLGDAQAAVRGAVRSIAALPHTRTLACSGLYQTAALGAEGAEGTVADSPDFVNAVMAVVTRLDAHDLLSHLQRLENQAGRTRPYPNAPRRLDLDLLLYGRVTLCTPTLQIPHPRMNERAFVLVPLAEIAPDQVRTAALRAVSAQRIHRLDGV